MGKRRDARTAVRGEFLVSIKSTSVGVPNITALAAEDVSLPIFHLISPGDWGRFLWLRGELDASLLNLGAQVSYQGFRKQSHSLPN